MAIPVLILILLLYLCVAYITYHTQGWYAYSFLNPGDHGQKSGLVAGYCFGILAAIIVIFLISWSLIRLRQWSTGGKIKRSPYDPLRGRDGYAEESFDLQSRSSEMKHAVV